MTFFFNFLEPLLRCSFFDIFKKISYKSTPNKKLQTNILKTQKRSQKTKNDNKEMKVSMNLHLTTMVNKEAAAQREAEIERKLAMCDHMEQRVQDLERQNETGKVAANLVS